MGDLRQSDSSSLKAADESAPTRTVGRVLGTEDSTPLEFWVGVEPGQVLQLDDVVAVNRDLPDGATLQMYGIVNHVRARHEGARFDSDVFLISEGVLPAQVSESARVLTTRFQPEIYVPPIPGQPVRKAVAEERGAALYFDQMEQRLALGLSRDNEPVFADLAFVDGTKGAHINISGISGVATKTSYALFLIYSLFESGVLGLEATNSKALVFNVKGEDLLFIDKPNLKLKDEDRLRYQAIGLAAGPFESVSFWAPPKRGDQNGVPDVNQRSEGVRSFYWTLYDFCHEGLLEFLFADVDDERHQYTLVAQTVVAQLRKALPSGHTGAALVEGDVVQTFEALVELIANRVDSDQNWQGRASQGTISAFVRRLKAAGRHVGHLIRADLSDPKQHRIEMERRVTVVDIHNLNDRAQRFVVGVMLRRTMDEKERSGSAKPLWFVVLDELNKYAPREGYSPIKEVLVDIAERGRSLGMILVGAQQTASEVESRVCGMCAIRVVGRLDSAEAGRADYGYLKGALQARSIILKPGTMIVSQPLIPVPLVVEFPYPAWATRSSEAPPDPPNAGEANVDVYSLFGGAR